MYLESIFNCMPYKLLSYKLFLGSSHARREYIKKKRQFTKVKKVYEQNKKRKHRFLLTEPAGWQCTAAGRGGAA